MKELKKYNELLRELEKTNYAEYSMYIVDSMGDFLNDIIEGWDEESRIDDIPRLERTLKEQKITYYYYSYLWLKDGAKGAGWSYYKGDNTPTQTELMKHALDEIRHKPEGLSIADMIILTYPTPLTKEQLKEFADDNTIGI